MNLYRRFVDLLLLPIFLRPFFERSVGEEYGVGFFNKAKLLFKIRRIVRRIPTATSWYEHVLMAKTILQIPSSVKGVVIECGAFKGGSTASLSLVCSLTRRELIIFDSFQGLPEPEKLDREHYYPYINRKISYSKGDYSGSLKEVKKNIEKYGCLDICKFVVGYFKDTAPVFTKKFNGKIAFIFLDIDLKKSLETCIFYLWPLLQDCCFLFTHEVQDLEISSLFFDKEWWATHLGLSPPGLIGAGNGLCFNTKFGSSLGYTINSNKL